MIFILLVSYQYQYQYSTYYNFINFINLLFIILYEINVTYCLITLRFENLLLLVVSHAQNCLQIIKINIPIH